MIQAVYGRFPAAFLHGRPHSTCSARKCLKYGVTRPLTLVAGCEVGYRGYIFSTAFCIFSREAWA